jgi:hypothetical protein
LKTRLTVCPYFLCTLLRARCSQVHKIDACDKQYNNGDDGKKPYISYAASLLYAIYKIAAQVPVVHAKVLKKEALKSVRK